MGDGSVALACLNTGCNFSTIYEYPFGAKILKIGGGGQWMTRPVVELGAGATIDVTEGNV